MGERIGKVVGEDVQGFAEKAGIDIADLKAYIEENDTPGRDHIKRIAEAGDVTPEYIARGAEVVSQNADKKALGKHIQTTSENSAMANEHRVLRECLNDRKWRAVHNPDETEIEVLREFRVPGVVPDKQFISDVLVAVRELKFRSEE
jgi:hypothetical protein